MMSGLRNSVQVTECEVLLSYLVKLAEPERKPWQRALALEALHRILSCNYVCM